MAETETLVKSLRDGLLKILDGTGTPNEVELVCDEGNLAFTVVPGGKEVKQILDRGALSHLRYGDEKPIPVSFDLKFKEFISIAGTTPKTVYEALMKVGRCSTWTSVIADGGGVYGVKLEFNIDTPVSGAVSERVIFNKFVPESVDFKEGDPNTLSVKGFDFETAPEIDKHTEDCATGCETGCETAQED